MSNYKSCGVPICRSTTIKTPKKLFIHVPKSPQHRKKWLRMARRDPKLTSDKCPIYFCEDHFDLPNDMENYMQYRIMGSISRIRMKPNCLPSKFKCQPDRKKRTAPLRHRSAASKRQHMEVIQNIFSQESETPTTSGMTVDSGQRTELHAAPMSIDVYVKVEIKSEEEESGAIKCELEVEPEQPQTQDASFYAQGAVKIEIKQEPKEEPLSFENEGPYLCNICLKTFDLQSRFLNHSCAPGEETDLKQEVFSETLKIHMQEDAYQCDTCKEMFTSKTILINHMKLHKSHETSGEESKDLTSAVSDKLSCQICNKQFKLKANLTEHMRAHTGIKPYSCPICKKQFTRKATSNKHMQRHLKGKPVPSNNCSNQLIDKSNLKDIQIDSNEQEIKPYCCQICNKQYSEKRYLARHERLHETDKLLPCNVCSSKFPFKSDLVRHMQVHSEERPFSCQFCGKQFADKFVLAKHLRIHSGVKPHCCEICKKAFREKSSLVRHMLTHTGEKRHSCQICNRLFLDSSTLTRHARTHTEEIPYPCNVCKKEFKHRRSLSRHERLNCQVQKTEKHNTE